MQQSKKKPSHEMKTLSVYFQIEALSIFCLFDDDDDLWKKYLIFLMLLLLLRYCDSSCWSFRLIEILFVNCVSSRGNSNEHAATVNN